MKRLAATLTLAAVLSATGLQGGAAWAQLQPASKSPVRVTGDETEATQSECLNVWRGSVEALQDQSRLRSNILKVYFKKGPPAKPGPNGQPGQQQCGDLDRMEADGEVYYVTPDRQVRGDHGVYTADDDQIVMTGGVVAMQGQNVVKGDRMVIHVKDGSGHMESAAKGRGKPNRVSGVFYPKDDNGTGGGQGGGKPAKPAAKPADAPAAKPQ